MSVANRYKVLTLSGALCFAMLRSIAARENHLLDRLDEAEKTGEGSDIRKYLTEQLVDIRATREAFNNTPFQEGRPS